mmetsp:Transcript_17995/g.59252  ORF Transcript_17995/g.59252 Transcript_17995/m.59252 type:complete len:211 (+) Transcript_17995:1338-1970(+)
MTTSTPQRSSGGKAGARRRRGSRSASSSDTLGGDTALCVTCAVGLSSRIVARARRLPVAARRPACPPLRPPPQRARRPGQCWVRVLSPCWRCCGDCGVGTAAAARCALYALGPPPHLHSRVQAYRGNWYHFSRQGHTNLQTRSRSLAASAATVHSRLSAIAASVIYSNIDIVSSDITSRNSLYSSVYPREFTIPCPDVEYCIAWPVRAAR